ncbi:MAG: type II toxin-antitoxin system Phd/YefM family antitoxin [Acidobacteria bacterium]|nr:type II toxin-antitoxin system Phd/YefM family antitoxin [Acidobacteriota bacterium]
MAEVSVTQARNTLTRLIREVEAGEIVHITRRGKPAAVLVSKDEYDRLASGRPRQDFWQAIQDWRSQASFDWPELTPDEVDGWRDRRPPREPEWSD